jgi:two-component sensor histidine kinase
VVDRAVGSSPIPSARERELLESLRESETLLREVHHRVKNNLQVLASLLAMQIDATSDPFIKRALSDAALRISTIGMIHAQLCEAPIGASVDMRVFVHELVANLRRTLSNSRTGIATRLSLEPLTFPLDVATHCGLLISELVTNAFQHAFVHIPDGVIDIGLARRGREVILMVQDNGVGLPRDANRPATNGIGMRLVRLLATRQLRGHLSISRQHGTRVTVRFASSGARND